MSSRRSRRGTTAAFPALSEGIQNGLRRLVSDHAETVASMLDLVERASSNDTLCEKCAQVMKQQQMSASSFLARFFAADVLSEHAVLLGKSGKGSAATLGDRIAAEWAKNKAIPTEAPASPDKATSKIGKEEKEGEHSPERKRKKQKVADEAIQTQHDTEKKQKTVSKE